MPFAKAVGAQPRNIDGLKEIELDSGRKINTILQPGCLIPHQNTASASGKG